METKATVALEFTDDHYIALGKLVVAFQSLEEAITFGLGRLMRPNRKEYTEAFGFTSTVLDELSSGSRLKLLSNYVETHPATYFVPPGSLHEQAKLATFEAMLEALRPGIRMAEQAEKRRNELIHSYWIADPFAGPPGTVFRMKTRAKFNKVHDTSALVAAEEIYFIVEEMDKAREIILKAVGGLHALLRAAIHDDKTDPVSSA